MALGWLKKEEEEDDEHAILTFDCFRFATLKSYYTLLLLLQSGAGAIK